MEKVELRCGHIREMELGFYSAEKREEILKIYKESQTCIGCRFRYNWIDDDIKNAICCKEVKMTSRERNEKYKHYEIKKIGGMNFKEKTVIVFVPEEDLIKLNIQ